MALENHNDVNEAVNDILIEIIPRLYEETNLPSKDTSLEVASNIEGIRYSQLKMSVKRITYYISTSERTLVKCFF